MRLVNTQYNVNILFEENFIETLVIENKETLCSFIRDFKNQIKTKKGGFVLSDGQEIIDFKTNCEIIIDPFSLELNKKAFITSLFKKFIIIEDTVFDEKQEINTSILKIIYEIFSKETMLEIKTDLDFSWMDIFKIYNISFQEETMNLLELLENYLKLISELTSVKVIVFVNIKSYLTRGQLEELYQIVSYLKLHILQIEGIRAETIKEERIKIIDKDKCLIVI